MSDAFAAKEGFRNDGAKLRLCAAGPDPAVFGTDIPRFDIPAIVDLAPGPTPSEQPVVARSMSDDLTR